MRKSMLMAAILPFLLVGTVAMAQSKVKNKIPKEKKNMEEKFMEKRELRLLKKMDPRQIKAMKVGLEKKGQELDQCSSTRDSLNNALFALQVKAAEQDSIIRGYENTAIAKGKVGESKSGNTIAPKNGIIFTVQLGAFKEFNISDKLGDSGLQIENDEGMSKYLLGTFKSLDKAESFRKEIVKMGIKDAWVVAFKDGKRITKEEAAEIIGESVSNE